MGVMACADLLRVSERTLRGWESGATRIPYAAYKLLRVLKGGRYLAHPIWKDFVIRGDTLITPEGHPFHAGDLGWWSLLVRQARAFRELLRDRDARVAPGLPGRPEVPAETTGADALLPAACSVGSSEPKASIPEQAPALGLVSSSTSDTRPTPKAGSTAENKASGTGQLVAARKGKAPKGQRPGHQQAAPDRLARKASRTRYSTEFKQQALARATQDGVAVAAKDLGLQESQIYAWRIKARLESHTSEEQRLLQSEQARLKREVARLEEENAFLKKAAAYFAKQPK